MQMEAAWPIGTSASTDATAAASRPAVAPSRALLTVTLLAILLANFFVRRTLDESDKHLKSFFIVAYKDKLPQIHSMKWHKYFLPCKELTGAWGTTGLFTVYGLEHLLGGPENGGTARAYYLGNALLVATSFVLSWFVFRSYVFSTTFALCLALTTYNHHVYQLAGTTVMPFIMTYLLCFLFCQYKLMQPDCNYRRWIPLGGLSLAVYALSYEGWLDCPAWMWILYPVLIAAAWRHGDRRRVRAGACILAATTFAAAVYVLIKTRYGYGQGQGSESDVVFNYGRKYPWLVVEDLMSHFYTLFYTTVITYLPPQLCYSNSLWSYGPEEIVRLQGGYDQANVQKVVYNHIFLWRYLAGALALAFVCWWWRSVKSVWNAPSKFAVGFFLTLSMVLLSGATHMIVKYRPMHSLPFIGYHCYFGVVGMSVLLALVATWLKDNVQRPRLAWTAVGLLWFNLVYCAVERPAMLSNMSLNAGYGPYPSDAKKVVRELLGVKPAESKP